MPTAKQIATEVLDDLMQLEIIKLLHPETRDQVTLDSQVAQNVIGALSKGCYDAIKGINAHRPIDPDTQLMAPFPGMDEPMSEDKIQELGAALDKYET